LIVPHNLIHKYKHALLNKSFKAFNSKKETTHKHTKTKGKCVFKKTQELKEIEKNIN
jgi:hypothetical protein